MDTGGESSSAGAAAHSAAAAPSVPVLLRTTHSHLAIPLAPYMVPLSWRRSHLSTLVNRILQPTTPTPLDFIVDGQLLRTSLAEYLESAGKDAESTLELLYVPSTLPPKYEGAFEHDDWVASVDARGAAPSSGLIPGLAASTDKLLLTASYDGAVRVWSHANVEDALLTFNTSSAAAGSLNPSLVDAIWTASSDNASANFVTAGMDGVIRAWNVPLSAWRHDPSATNGAAAAAAKARPRPLWTGPASLTSAPLSSLHTTADGNHVLAAAWDGTLSLWASNPSANEESNAASAFFVGQPDPEEEDEEEDGDEEAGDAGTKRSAHRKKRRTLARTKAAASALAREPLQVMSHVPLASSLGLGTNTSSTTRVAGPNSKVSRAIFAAEQGSGSTSSWTAFSCGWDGAVKEWDLSVGGRSITSKSCDKVLLTMDQLHGASSSSAILISGHMDRSAAIWDMRSDVATPTLALPGAHTAPISALRTHPKNNNLFATGSHDGTLKLWDTRSPRTALFSLTRPGGPSKGSSKTSSSKSKILAMDWDASGKMLFSGGDDCKLSVHRGEGMDGAVESVSGKLKDVIMG
ncbi:ribosome biogenesis protein ytm1 [Tilletia horrida]|nr:ribosome biogenesis protein ytm1 [Tilletia horrida]